MVQSYPNSVWVDESESGKWNQLRTKSVQKPSEGIDKVEDIIEDIIQDFDEGIPPPNKWFTEETECNNIFG